MMRATMMRNWTRLGYVVALTGALGACAVGPDYKKPDAPVPVAYKEMQGWKIGTPGRAASDGAWWSIYDDPVLDSLMKQIDISNQNLKAAEAAYREARAAVSGAQASFFPTVSLNGGATRAGSGSTATGTGTGSKDRTTYSASAGADWALDIWGRIRRSVESSSASAEASADDLAGARLSAQTELATDYFQLRALDEQKRLLDATIIGYAKSLDIVKNKYASGVAARADVLTAETQLKGTQAQVVNLGVQRAALEHAIAVLTGRPPAALTLASGAFATDVPVFPTDLPSSLLERRPDIAGAERRMAAANAQIGVAEAAYFPDLTLSASYGYSSSTLGKLFQLPNSIWSVGPSLAATLLNGGATSAQVEQARAAYDQSVANYRQTVLTGFQQVEDNLASLRILEDQAKIQADTVASAREAERLTINQYKAGTVDYTSVVTAQATRLNSEITALGIQRDRLTASVALVSAVGGGWKATP